MGMVSLYLNTSKIPYVSRCDALHNEALDITTEVQATLYTLFSQQSKSGVTSFAFDGQEMMSATTLATLEKTLYCGIVPVLFFVAVPTNILNSVVFYRQGLSDRMNVCLFSLALADMLFVTFLFLNASYCLLYFLHPQMADFWKWHVRKYILNFVTAFRVLNACFTSIIALDRCICVVFPFKAAAVMTKRTMASLILALTVIVNVLCLVYVLNWKIVSLRNPQTGNVFFTSAESDLFLQNKAVFTLIDKTIIAFVIPFTNFIIVSVATILTVVRLRTSLTWRQSVSNGGADVRRETKLIKMLLIVSWIFIVCMAPYIALSIARTLIPDLTFEGRYANLYFAMVYLLLTLAALNSSVHFFVYMAQSSRFRVELRDCFCPSRIVKKKTETKVSSLAAYDSVIL